MKLDAAALLEFDRPSWVTLILSLVLLVFASSASALDGIDISAQVAAMNEPGDANASAPAAGECPRLIQIKYPFLKCAHGQIGMSDADDDWENSRQIPKQARWVEGDGYFGPDLNQE